MERRLGHYARELTEAEVQQLERDKELSTFQQNKLEKEARKNWDLFYKRNSTHFFKDRHWITREFPELLHALSELDQSRPVLLEVGCGVGNTVFPLLEENTALFVHACDFSPRAVDFVKASSAFSAARCNVFVCDVTTDDLSDSVSPDSVDLALMIFVLSAISSDKMIQALKNVFQVLKPGGSILFRDYGLYDHAMLRFGRGHKISDNFYVRQDGTRAYYFSEEKLAEICSAAGFGIVENRYITKQTVNHKEALCVPRVFIQGRFIKPRPHVQTGSQNSSPVLPSEAHATKQ